MKNKKLTIFLLLSLMGLIVLLSSCKKGNEDPSISLRTRLARLAGDWQLTQYAVTQTQVIDTIYQLSSLLCDTANVWDNKGSTDIMIENSFGKPILTIDIDIDQGSRPIGGQNFTVRLVYVLSINKDGTYICKGNYSFEDQVLGANFSGDFTSNKNIWFWEASSASKTAITFVNFPTIDATSILTEHSPVKIVDFQTFDLLKLSNGEIKFEYETREINNSTRVCDAFVIETEDEELECTKTMQINNRLDASTIWTLRSPDDEGKELLEGG